jgi:hypothetical protein
MKGLTARLRERFPAAFVRRHRLPTVSKNLATAAIGMAARNKSRMIAVVCGILNLAADQANI